MSKTKLITSLLLAMAVLFAQVGIVAAAPPAQDTTPPTITEITTETDENGVTTVLVTVQVEGEPPQTMRISLDYALELGLIDPTTQEPVLPENVPPDTTIDPTRVIEVVPPEEPTEPDVHPISMLLAKFFFGGAEDDLSSTYEMASAIDSFHNGDYENGEGETLDQVFGFGVIAQALWMAKDSEGTDIELAGDILQFKRDKDFGDFLEAHPEYEDQFGDETPTNWGQFKKVLREKKQNLGVIVSGQADESTEDPALQQNPDQQNQGNDKQDKPEKQKKPKKQKKH
jgi:hypothetical protein